MDQAFRDEAPAGTAKALASADNEINGQSYGLAPQVKHVLWANLYSGVCSHDAACLHELTVYVLRQRAMLEGLARGDFFMCRWDWAEFAVRDSKSLGRAAPSPLSE